MAQNKLIEDLQLELEKSDHQFSSAKFIEAFIGDSLCNRIASDSNEQNTADFLRRATKLAYKTLLEYLPPGVNSPTRKEKYILNQKYENNLLSVSIVQEDRSFIIHTLLLCARLLNLEVEEILHPVIHLEHRHISVVYLEISNPEESLIRNFVDVLAQSFNELHLATDAYAGNLRQIEEFAVKTKDQTVKDLINWCSSGNFLLWGTAKYQAASNSLLDASGILSQQTSRSKAICSQINHDCIAFGSEDRKIYFSKLNIESLIQREQFLSTISIKSNRGDEILVLAGIYGSKVTQQDAKATPTVRETFDKLIASLEFKENSFDYDYALETLDRMPRDCLLRFSQSQLLKLIHAGISFYSSKRVQLSYIPDIKDRFTMFLVILPKDRYNSDIRKRIQRKIEERFGAKIKSSEIHIDISLKPQAKLYLSLPVDIGSPDSKTIESIEEELTDQIISAKERFINSVNRLKIEGVDLSLVDKYWGLFDQELIASVSCEELAIIISLLESVSEESKYAVKIIPDLETTDSTSARLYRLILTSYAATPLSVSKSLPVLQFTGFDVKTANSHSLAPVNKNIHIFDISHLNIFSAEALEKLALSVGEIFSGVADNDLLNGLLTFDEFTTRKVQLLRTYCCALFQMNKSYRLQSIFDSLISYPEIAVILSRYFEQKFNPAVPHSIKDRIDQSSKLKSELLENLRLVSEVAKDKIIRSIFILMENTVRTNFFHNTINITVKIKSREIDFLAQPRPLFEIFTKSPHFEGVHLRSDKVVRGGIRWSERPDDYRNEIHGLMKTQMSKNVLIVPGGAKGGFIVRNPPKDPAQLMSAVENSYKDFVRGCLSVADNYSQAGEIVHPEGFIIYDEADPYFVMAADKGTATFSDIANQIAQKEFGFWLQDAFASGGSQGYDHKKYGITAKGAWESVKRHFKEGGIQYETEPFTVVGIGDMSGDVFGNGLIYSRNIRLIGAFNHKHIFIDPTPDPEKSYQERVRLFTTPRTQWSDYNKDLISQGGGIFLRTDKEIRLSPEARQALSIEESVPEVMNGEELASHVLKAKCHLLWNGGIGTYVKASFESQADVLDPTNDSVRVNSAEIRATAIGEGGNLGLTQNARIEYAQNQGRINTDAIDNSGGVDLSDHEVNIKILFQNAIKQNKLDIAKRNKVLEKIAPEVVSSVLEHNRSHAIALTLFEERSVKSLPYIESLIRSLEKSGFVNRKTDNLPDYDGIKERQRKNKGLTRPELANLLAKIKMWVKESLLASKFLSSPLLNEYLVNYFPASLKGEYYEFILKHPLAKNIIATELTGIFINSIGLTFVHRLSQQLSVPPSRIVEFATCSDQIINFRKFLPATDLLDTTANNSEFIEARKRANKALRLTSMWIAHIHGTDSVDKIIELYKWPFITLTQNLAEVFNKERMDEIDAISRHYLDLGMDLSAANLIATYEHIIDVLQLLSIARLSARDIREVGKVYFEIYDSLKLGDMIRFEGNIPITNKWEHEVLQSAFAEIPQIASRLSIEFFKGIQAHNYSLPEIQQMIKAKLEEFTKSSIFESYSSSLSDFISGQKNVSQFVLLVSQAKKLTL